MPKIQLLPNEFYTNRFYNTHSQFSHSMHWPQYGQLWWKYIRVTNKESIQSYRLMMGIPPSFTVRPTNASGSDSQSCRVLLMMYVSAAHSDANNSPSSNSNAIFLPMKFKQKIQTYNCSRLSTRSVLQLSQVQLPCANLVADLALVRRAKYAISGYCCALTVFWILPPKGRSIVYVIVRMFLLRIFPIVVHTKACKVSYWRKVTSYFYTIIFCTVCEAQIPWVPCPPSVCRTATIYQRKKVNCMKPADFQSGDLHISNLLFNLLDYSFCVL